MRKVTSQTVYAFIQRQSRAVGNTMTDGDTLFLHGNRIAWWDGGGLFATLAGWPTVTTRERLNGLCEAAESYGFKDKDRKRFSQSDWGQYFGNDCIGADSVVQLA